jgi:hypothetical protein
MATLAKRFLTAIGAAMLTVGADAMQGSPQRRTGAKNPDGAVAAGVSRDTGKPMYTTDADAPGSYNWNEAAAYCAALETGGHDDWRVPSRTELNQLFKSRSAIPGLNTRGSFPAGWYWSSLEHASSSNVAWAQRFSDGFQSWSGKGGEFSLRCVRSPE